MAVVIVMVLVGLVVVVDGGEEREEGGQMIWVSHQQIYKDDHDDYYSFDHSEIYWIYKMNQKVYETLFDHHCDAECPWESWHFPIDISAGAHYGKEVAAAVDYGGDDDGVDDDVHVAEQPWFVQHYDFVNGDENHWSHDRSQNFLFDLDALELALQ